MHNELADVELPPDKTSNASRNKEDALKNLKALIGSNPDSPGVDSSEPELYNDNQSFPEEETGLTDQLDQKKSSVSQEVSPIETGGQTKDGPEAPEEKQTDLGEIEVGDIAVVKDIDQDILTPDSAADSEIPPRQEHKDEKHNNTEEEALPSTDDFALKMEDTAALTVPPNKSKESGTKKKPENKASTKADSATDSAGQVEISWDDIPVLNEVVAPPPTPDDTTTKQAREIAIKVAATLNIELRREGTDTMDIKTIMRLQSLLGRELADHDESIDQELDEDVSDHDKTNDDDA